MLTEADIRRFAPKAKPEYVAALLGGMDHLRAAGILDSELRLCHFMGQCGAETGGFTIVRESLTYTSAARLRTVWPARFRNKSDAELAHLIRNPVALGDAVYMGRMGNTAPGDGYAYRGGGFLQTTGKDAVLRYCKLCGVEPRADILDDIPMTLRFACAEWQQSGCNQWADENDLIKVSKAINTGSAFSNVKPVGMAHRQEWFARAWAIWGDKVEPGAKPDPGPLKGSRIVATSNVGETVATGGVLAGVGLSLADALGYAGQILPLVKEYSIQMLIAVLLVLAAGFAIVKHFRKQDHETGKTVQ